MTSLGPPPPSVVDAAIRLLSSPEELQEDLVEGSLKTLGNSRLDQGGCEALRKNLRNGRSLERVFDAFTDSVDTARQDDAANVLVCAVLNHRAEVVREVTHHTIPLCGSPQRFISRLATLLTDTDNDTVAAVAFALLVGAMIKGRIEGNAADYRDHCVQHHPAIFGKAVALLDKIPGGGCSKSPIITFLLSAFSRERAFGPPFPGPSAVPPLVWVGMFRVIVRVLTCEDQATRDALAACIEHATAFVRHHIHRVTGTGSGSDADRAVYLAAIREDIYPLVDTLAATLTSSAADKGMRGGAAVCLECIFGFCCDFKSATEIDVEYFRDADGPVQRLMRAPNALQAYVAAVKSPANTLASTIRTGTLPLAVLEMVAVCGHRDAVYSSGCISMASDIVKRLDKQSVEEVAYCAAALQKIVGSDTDLTDMGAKIAVRAGLPVALCDVAMACIKNGQLDFAVFIDFAVETLRALVSYGDRVSSKRGGVLRSNGVTQAVLQHDSVKTMRAAERQPKGRRKANRQHQEQLTVPKKLLYLFDEIESAANERAEKIIAELDIEGTQEGAEDTNDSKGVKKRSKGKRGGKGASTKESASPSSCGAIGTSEDHSEQPDEDAEDHHGLPGPPSPSPPSPPRPSCSFSSSASVPSAVSGGSSASVGGGSGQQQGTGGGGDGGGGFITVGRKKKGGKGGNALQQQQQQQTNTADEANNNSRVFPSSSSSESTRPSSSHSSVSGGPHHAPPFFPLAPRPAVPPSRSPNRHTPTPAPSSSRGGSDEHGLAPLAAGDSSSSTLERAVEVEGRSGQGRCGGEVSELDALRQQLEAMRLEKEAIEREKKRLEEERESTECDICMAEKKSIVLIPCRHFCLCGACATALMSKPVAERLCPRCRQAITATRHVYL
ncbi:unnamed protein product [Vitrella brassicaformis CCMP3155]|uniref:RING-type domain-containing protein n=1 Tax=Vitrella brassicaformis (strain CCMP3155) TaxID=1169540 RepID=A0A0G4FWE1_VITBC|nr:unnamed protein product [Vitrella brassicaformis CCMP3155]|eukprot:CEM19092.1 unnamed protein product [Vitrella brassicaformis CCMP3155]